MKTKIKTFAALCLTGLAVTMAAHAGLITTDSFGSGANAFNIQFAHIGNAGNGNDGTGSSYTTGGGLYGSGTTFGLGGVAYNYRMGVVEVAQDWITKATNLGMTNVTAGAWSASQPAANMRWYEAAAFVNWLNTSTGHQAAYQLNGTNTALTLWTSAQAWQAGGENLYRHKDAYYFLPSESEWYKAAYHKNDGVTANFWDYPTQSNGPTLPTPVASGTGAGTAVYNGQAGPANVTLAGGLSAYGTMGQGGNVYEWAESAFDGTNNSPSEFRALRGGIWENSEGTLRSSFRNFDLPSLSTNYIGLRVASVPEPSTVMVGVGLSLMCLLRRRRLSAL